jgi:hypothetical protein
MVRVPVPGRPSRGDELVLRVDLDRLLIFDRTGHRIASTGPC